MFCGKQDYDLQQWKTKQNSNHVQTVTFLLQTSKKSYLNRSKFQDKIT